MLKFSAQSEQLSPLGLKGLKGKKICTVISTLGQQEKLQLENTALSGPGKLLVGKNSPMYTSK